MRKSQLQTLSLIKLKNKPASLLPIFKIIFFLHEFYHKESVG
ncbi:hypothetical protein DB42_AK00980 [Neochlamydia sp. EPS4]|nr:hypothetical protein DB42_AK00980 [Neochlamydia sp. EPS4]